MRAIRSLPCGVAALLASLAVAHAERVNNPTAVFNGLDKITGRITSFDVTINQTVQFGALQVTPRVCYTRSASETPQTTAFIEVNEETLQKDSKRIFTGWMFAASPGLHAVEHPVYDIWLTSCKGGKTNDEPPPAVTTTEAPPRAKTGKAAAPSTDGGGEPFATPNDTELPVD